MYSADSFVFFVIRRSYTVLAAHCLEIRSRKLNAEELKIGLGKLLKDFYTHEEGAMIISVSILCLLEFIKGKNANSLHI